MLIEIFGPGCAKCHRSAETAREFLSQDGHDGEVIRYTEIDAMLERGILRTPTVFVDGQKVVEGRVLRRSDLEKWFTRTGG
jgi:small redox-active disulfide protein 2